MKMNNVLSVMMPVNIVFQNKTIIAEHVKKIFFWMKINANNAIAVVNNVSKNQITVYPVKIHFICRKKHVNYVMKLVKNV